MKLPLSSILCVTILVLGCKDIERNQQDPQLVEDTGLQIVFAGPGGGETFSLGETAFNSGNHTMQTENTRCMWEVCPCIEQVDALSLTFRIEQPLGVLQRSKSIVVPKRLSAEKVLFAQNGVKITVRERKRNEVQQ